MVIWRVNDRDNLSRILNGSDDAIRGGRQRDGLIEYEGKVLNIMIFAPVTNSGHEDARPRRQQQTRLHRFNDSCRRARTLLLQQGGTSISGGELLLNRHGNPSLLPSGNSPTSTIC